MMSTIWLIAKNEYKRHVMRRSYIIIILSLPLIILLMLGLGYIIISIENDSRPVGYIDQSGVLAEAIPAPLDSSLETPIEMIAYSSTEEARAKLDSGEIQAYYLLPADYQETKRVELVYVDDVGEDATGQFWDFMRVNLMADMPQETVDLVTKGAEITIRNPDGSREFSKSQILNILLPLLVSFALMILLLTSSGYLIAIVAEEKENRTMEILMTSISPNQLVTGKLLGIIGVVATQVTVWLTFLFGFIYLVSYKAGFSWAQNLTIEPYILFLVIGVMVPAYIIYAAFMTAIGSMVSATQEGQQIAGFVSFLLYIPFIFVSLMIQSPNSPLMVGLSIFPLTAPMIITMRTIFTVVPFWQIALSVTTLTATAVFSVWLAGRALRLGMLRYGQRLKFSEIFRNA